MRKLFIIVALIIALAIPSCKCAEDLGLFDTVDIADTDDTSLDGSCQATDPIEAAQRAYDAVIKKINATNEAIDSASVNIILNRK